MDQLFTFIGNHPYLVGAFVVLLALFIRNEMSRGGATVSAQELVNLVNKEGEQIQNKESFRQILFAVTEIVLQVIAVVLQGVEALVLDFPSCPRSTHQVLDILSRDLHVGDP